MRVREVRSSSPIGKEACADVIIAYAQKLQK